MPYTNAWSNVIPAGTILARQLDDHIRQVRLDVAERMADLVEDWTADPVVPKEIWKGAVTGKKLIVPAAFGMIDTNAALDVIENGAGIQNSASQFVIPLPLPLGVTVTLVELLADRRSNASITWDLYVKSFSGAAAVSQASVLHNIAGDVISATGVLALVTDADSWMYVLVNTSGAAKDIYAARVTYNTPDARNTI